MVGVTLEDESNTIFRNVGDTHKRQGHNLQRQRCDGMRSCNTLNVTKMGRDVEGFCALSCP